MYVLCTSTNLLFLSDLPIAGSLAYLDISLPNHGWDRFIVRCFWVTVVGIRYTRARDFFCLGNR